MDRLTLLADLLRKPTGLLGDTQQSIPVGSLLNPATVNPLMARKVEAQRQTMPIANALIRYNESYPQSWGEFGENVKQAFPTPASGGTREQILAAAQNLAMGIGPQMTVYHGSPHLFPPTKNNPLGEFNSSKIGTGEGKQQQGVGSYLAEAKEVGQKYADKEAWKRGMDSGYLYKVDAPDELIASMANHDFPMYKQPQSVKSAVNELLDENAKKALKNYHGWEDVNEAPFAAVMDALEIARGNNRAATSEILRQAGIPGIRYLDGGSRTGGQGTSNFVVFPGNEGLLKILERQ